jgi:hypothetical protein
MWRKQRRPEILEFYQAEIYGRIPPSAPKVTWQVAETDKTIDYFETDGSVNAKRIAITGASRLGKTVLWAGAQDERVAAVCAVVPGEMGASLIRRNWGEALDDMARNFPWQFAGNFQKWVGKWDDMPVDQHMLIALCAPRPVYVNGGGQKSMSSTSIRHIPSVEKTSWGIRPSPVAR